MIIVRPNLPIKSFPKKKANFIFLSPATFIIRIRQMIILFCESTESPTIITLCYNGRLTYIYIYTDNKD